MNLVDWDDTHVLTGWKNTKAFSTVLPLCLNDIVCIWTGGKLA